MTSEQALTILVVEDQAPVRQLICRMLTRRGFKTIEAGNGLEAIALYQEAQGTIDLAIIDMVMPQMSGLDVAAELGRQNPELKILYISACAGSIAIDSIRRRAPEFLLLKPFTERSLVERVGELLGVLPNHPIVSATSKPARLSDRRAADS